MSRDIGEGVERSNSLRTTTCAAIIHYGDVQDTVTATCRLSTFDAIDRVVIVANDRAPRPAGLDAARVTWLVPESNLGFAGGCMYAASKVRADKYAFLNADVELSLSAFVRCFEVLDDRTVGVVGPLLQLPGGAFQSGHGVLTRFLADTRQLLPTSPQVDCDWVTGAALFTRKDVLETIGMDPSYFLAYEDADYCARVRQGGLRVLVVSDVAGTHRTGATLTTALYSYYAVRNRIWFVRRHRGVMRAVVVTSLAWLRLPRFLAANIIRGRWKGSSSYVRGIVHAWTLFDSNGRLNSDEPIPTKWLGH